MTPEHNCFKCKTELDDPGFCDNCLDEADSPEDLFDELQTLSAEVNPEQAEDLPI